MKLQELRQIIREEISKTLNEDQDLAMDIVNGIVPEDLRDNVVDKSIKFIYGPDDEGTFHLKFLMEIDELSYDTPEEELKALHKALGGHRSNGPGGSYRNVSVYYEGKGEEHNYIFGVLISGGYDI